jgi:hypothetical protein
VEATGFVDYALSSGGGNIAASDSPTTVETVQVSNGAESCGNGNNGEPRGTTAYNNNCNAIDVNTQPGAMNTGARAPPREPPLAARSAPLLRLCAADEPPSPSPGQWCSTVGGLGSDNPNNPQELDEENRREKAVLFFFEAFSKFEVSDAPRRPHRCPPRWPAQRQGAPWPPREGASPLSPSPPSPPLPHHVRR